MGTGSLFRVCLPNPQGAGINATDAAPVATAI
jgi:hypothetical protein